MSRPEHSLTEPERVGRDWVLQCVCGWHSAGYTRDDLARSSGAMHVVEILHEPGDGRHEPADGLDSPPAVGRP